MVQSFLPLEYEQAYHPQCSSMSIYSFAIDESEDYDPSASSYYEDVGENNGKGGHALAIICLGVFLLLSIFSCVLCCVKHYWNEDADFISVVKSGKSWWQRLLAFLFIISILVVTAIITAMSIWGMVKVESDVKDVVPEAFDFLEDTEVTTRSIWGNLKDAVVNGNEIIFALRTALNEFRNDAGTQANLQNLGSGLGVNIAQITNNLEDTLDDAKDTLEVVETEVNENLEEILDGLHDAIEYRDEGEDINKAGRTVILTAFVLFIFFAVGSSLFSLYGVSPRCIMFWAIMMWFMLFIAFGCVAALDVGKQVSRDTCLYIDTYAVRELRKEVNRDEIRIAELLWYYFRPPSTGDKTLEELEKLWSFPLTDVSEFLSFAKTDVFNENGELKFPYNAVQEPTQEALHRVYDRIPKAQEDVSYVQDLIQGETFQTIHADLKKLICCTEYDAIETVWTAWVVSSSFGLLLAILMTLQGLFTLRCCTNQANGVPYVISAPPIKQSAYMGPPVEEQRYPSNLPLKSNNAQENNGVYYPEIQMPNVRY